MELWLDLVLVGLAFGLAHHQESRLVTSDAI